jgi:hypothetical protein
LKSRLIFDQPAFFLSTHHQKQAAHKTGRTFAPVSQDTSEAGKYKKSNPRVAFLLVHRVAHKGGHTS